MTTEKLEKAKDINFRIKSIDEQLASVTQHKGTRHYSELGLRNYNGGPTLLKLNEDTEEVMSFVLKAIEVYLKGKKAELEKEFSEL